MVGGDEPAVEVLGLSAAELRSALASADLPGYRAAQLFRWLHRAGELDCGRMTDLPAALRQQLLQRFCFTPLEAVQALHSADGSVKQLWRTRAGHPVESVWMPGFKYGSVSCISSHSGCPLRCGFCATGQLGLLGRLSAAEMLQQLYSAEHAAGDEAQRLVLMGMGEPLLSLDSVRRVVELLCSEEGHGWSPRRITVSTVGLVKPMLQLADSFGRVNLALSLHFTTEQLRGQYMPGAEPSPARLAEALFYYRQVNGGKISVEYTLLAGMNDAAADLRRLADFAWLRGLDPRGELCLAALQHSAPPRQQPLPLHVNLVEYNPIGRSEFTPSPAGRLDEFARLLAEAQVPVSVRHSRGRDIAAACGMLGAQSDAA